MYTLGIAYGFHDAGAAIVGDGKLIAASSEERFSRQKHDANFPRHAIQYCLDSAGIGIDQVAGIAYHESPSDTFTRVFASGVAGYPRSRREFVNGMKAWLGKKLWVQNEISRRLNVHPKRITCLNHHQSHASQAFLGSGFEEAAVLVIDAVGEWDTTSFYRAKWKDGRPELEPLEHIGFPHSLGLVYSAFTAFLGFIPMDGECSTMALAAFGQPIYADKVRRIFKVQPDGKFEVDQSYFNFTTFYREPWTAKFISDFGSPRGHHEKLPFDCFSQTENLTADSKRWADVAASIQLVTEEIVLQLATTLQRRTGLRHLCYAGGVALNCVANSQLLRDATFDRIYIPPDPGDGGAAVGAALFAGVLAKPSEPSLYHPFIGAQYDEQTEEAILPYINPTRFLRFVKPGHKPRTGERWKHLRYDNFEDLVRDVSADLTDGKIVGWCQGRFEHGPRALGHRSILIRPDNLDLARRLSAKVKDRAAYRPYALSVTEEEAGSLLVMDETVPELYRWMQAACAIRPEALPKVRAAIHIDGTTRPQICSAQENPRYHRLLRAMGEHLGCAALLNTSFNESGYPLVSSPVDALVVFARTDMDVLVFNNLVVRKTA